MKIHDYENSSPINGSFLLFFKKQHERKPKTRSETKKWYLFKKHLHSERKCPAVAVGSAQKPLPNGHGHLTCQFTDLFCKGIIYILCCHICPGALALPVEFKSAQTE